MSIEKIRNTVSALMSGRRKVYIAIVASMLVFCLLTSFVVMRINTVTVLEGGKEGFCSTCNSVVRFRIEKIEHVWGDVVETKAPTCTSHGKGERICSGCEVKAECLEYALHKDERFGIWGGLSERERRRLKRGII